MIGAEGQDGWRVDRLWLRRFVWLAFGWRILVSAITVIPGRDGVNYLWMSERMLGGDFQLALAEVFPPGWPILMAPFVALAEWIGLEAFRGAQIANAVYGALAVWPMLRCAERFGPRVLRMVGWLLVFAPLSARFGAEALSEPSTQLVLALGLWAALSGRVLLAGVMAALAFSIRPEAGALAIAVALAHPRKAHLALLPGALAFVLLASLRQALGFGFEAIPKFSFHDQNNLGAFTGEGVDWAILGRNILRLPFLFLEGLQGLGVLALVGLVTGARRQRLRIPVWSLVLASIAICGFIAKRRLFVPWMPVVAVLATYGLRRIPSSWRLAVFTPAMIFSVLASLDPQPDDRWAERSLGRYLGGLLEDGQRVTGDQTRVIYFAGCRPLPPRHYDAEEILAWCREPSVRFVVLTDYGRTKAISDAVRADLGESFRSLPLPEDVRQGVEMRELIVLERR